MKRIIIAMTGATGAPIAVKLLQALRLQPEIQVHLVVSNWAKVTLKEETSFSYTQLCELADEVHDARNLAAPIASGSFRVDSMIIVPCSMKTLASVRMGLSDNLIARAADVILKERKQLILVTREAPLSAIHLDNMLTLAKLGAVIFPPVLGFYHQPDHLDDILNHLVMRLLDQCGIEIHAKNLPRWAGLSKS